MEGAAIIDADQHGAAIVEIGDADVARQWQGGMGAGDGIGGKDLAIGGAPAMKGLAVPRGAASFDLLLIPHRSGLFSVGRGQRRGHLRRTAAQPQHGGQSERERGLEAHDSCSRLAISSVAALWFMV